jgi:hypothetical protein
MTSNDVWENARSTAQRYETGLGVWLDLRHDGSRSFIVFLGDPFPHELTLSRDGWVPFDVATAEDGCIPRLEVAINVVVYDIRKPRVMSLDVKTFHELCRVRDKCQLPPAQGRGLEGKRLTTSD